MNYSSKKNNTIIPQFAIGAIAGCVATAITHPMDLVKVRFQISPVDGSILPRLRAIYAEKGILSFYQGLSGGLLRQSTYTTARMGLYLKLRERYADEHNQISFTKKLLIAFVSGAFGSLVGSPADVCLIRMQADRSLPVEQRRNYKNAFEGLYRIVREEGFLALYRGASVNTLRAIFMTAGQIACYDQIKSLLVPFTGDTLATQTLAGAAAGFVSAAVTSPIDVVKTRLMNDKKRVYNGLVDCVTKTYRENGVKTFYRGFLAYLARLGPNTTLALLASEFVAAQFQKWGFL